MGTIDELFPALVSVVQPVAESRGFTATDEGGDAGAFGSRQSSWRRGAEALRLAWDAREQWVTFEHRPAPDYPPSLEWTGTLSERYTGANISDSDSSRLCAALESMLRSHWPKQPRP
jgi:hypothetical protein